ncbi:MAG: fibronectin type III domain-containing protein [Clostridiales bacterium]|jgi:hypothetical protein|nr:fibronectin type III domain-containing protein [Clostridiales bacterium]
MSSFTQKSKRRRAAAYACLLAAIGSLLTPRISVKTAFAAVNSIGVSFERSMTAGTDNAVPVTLYTGTEDDQAFLYWPMDQANGFGFSHGVYRLSYFIDKEKQVVFTVAKRGNTAEVLYDVLTWDTSQLMYVSKPPSGYDVHTNIDGGGLANYMPILSFLSGEYNVRDPDYQVLDFNADMDTLAPGASLGPSFTDLKPHFIIKPDTGFSFRYDNAVIHFKWNSADDSLYYVTNKMQTGYVFDFTLEFKELSGAFGVVGTQKILTGISKETFRAIPFANDGYTAAGPALDYDVDLHSQIRILEMGDPIIDEHPGAPENELALRFDIPKEYDAAARDFTNTPLGPLAVTLSLSNPISSNEIQIILDDILTNGAGSRINTSCGAVIKRAELVSADRYEVRLGDMPAGVLYNPVNISFAGGGITARRTDIALGKVFTFLNYEIIAQDGKFYALIRPYQGFSGYYMLKSGNPSTPAVTQYSDGVQPLMLPLTINAANQGSAYYQVFFSPEKVFVNNMTDSAVYSQVLFYKADNSKTSVGLPSNFQIVNYALYPDEGAENDEQGTLDFTLRWDVGDLEAIQTLAAQQDPLIIEYRLNQSLTPKLDDALHYDTIALTITEDNGILKVSYSDAKGRVMNTAQTDLLTRAENNNGVFGYTCYAEMRFQVPAALEYANLPAGTVVDFLYPNIYFLNVAPILLNGYPLDITASLFDSMTLNDLSKPLVPPPQNLTAFNPVTSDNPQEVSVQVSYVIPGEKLRDFFNSQYPYPEKDASVNLYISQNEKALRDTFLHYNLADRRVHSVAFPYDAASGGRLIFSEINGQPPMPAPPGYTDARDALRRGKIVSIEKISLSDQDFQSLLTDGFSFQMVLTLDGLDKNQKYYFCADIVAAEKDSGAIQLEQESHLSALAAVTTIGDKETPGVYEHIPPAPVLNKENVSLNMAVILWDPILGGSEADGVIEYEIIRLQDVQTPAGLLNTRDPFETFYARLDDFEKAGWRTDNGALEIYGDAGFEPADMGAYAYESGYPIRFTDYTLSPNQLYFYYVRTVRAVAGRRIVSVWGHISVTSTPVQAPKNLRARRDADYDSRTEIAIVFDAPIVDLNALGVKFHLQYQLQLDGGAWLEPVTMSPSALTENGPYVGADTLIPIDPGYTRFSYKIQALKPGVMYSIRVRMLDEDGNGSLYSNTIQIKTDVDQAIYDSDRKTDSWLEYLSDLLAKLFRNPYWITKDNANDFEAVYRPSHTDGFLRGVIGGRIPLASSAADRTVYYLPSSLVAAANKANQGFQIQHGDMELLLSAKAVNLEANDAILSIARQMKAGQIADYYIRVSVYWDQADYADAIRREAFVAIDAVGGKQAGRAWEDALMDQISRALAERNAEEDQRRFIQALIERNASNERLVLLMDRIERSARILSRETAASSLPQSLRGAFAVTRLDAPLILVTKNIAPEMAVEGYHGAQGRWLAKEILRFGPDKAVASSECGDFLFTGKIADWPANQSVDCRALIARYDLTDFWEWNDNDNMPVTRAAAAGVTARLAGAPKNAEPFAWLNQKGITMLAAPTMLAGNSAGDRLQRQEAVYLLMSLYAREAHVNLGALEIHGPNAAAADAPGLDGQYRQAVRAAYETGVLTEQNFQPAEPVTTLEWLKMIEKVWRLCH